MFQCDLILLRLEQRTYANEVPKTCNIRTLICFLIYHVRTRDPCFHDKRCPLTIITTAYRYWVSENILIHIFFPLVPISVPVIPREHISFQFMLLEIISHIYSSIFIYNNKMAAEWTSEHNTDYILAVKMF